PWNFVPACKECNRLKGPRGAREFLADPTRFLANPTTAQLARIVDVERRLQRRRLRWLERRRLLRERVQRRSAGVEKAVKTRRARLDAEEAEYQARRGRIRDGKNRYRQSLGLDPLPASPEKEAPGRVRGLPPKPAPRFLN